MNKEAVLLLALILVTFLLGVYVGRVITYPEITALALDLCTEG